MGSPETDATRSTRVIVGRIPRTATAACKIVLTRER